MKNSVFIETLGCSKNLVDSEQMIGILEREGYSMISIPNNAEIVIVNTCSFIHDAKVESIDTLLNMSEIKNGFLIMTGCLAQRYATDLLDEMPEVDAFVGTTHFHQIDEVIKRLRAGERSIILTDDVDLLLPEGLPRTLTTPTHFAYIKISEGCDNRCTYCIIPKLRGRYRSRKIEDIVKEVRMIVSEGIKEVILIAQDSTRYGHDLYGEFKLTSLLQELNEIKDLRWIRIQYMYPDVINRELIQTIANLSKVVNYFDIPIQHSSDRILRTMNRHTSRDEIIHVLEMIKEIAPDSIIRTTVIVGFPGETEEDFEDLMGFTKDYPFHRLGAFTYSQEEETPAGRLPDQIDDAIKKDRYERLMAQQMTVSDQMMQTFVGLKIEVIIEEKLEDEGIYIGRSLYDTPEVDGVVYVHTDDQLSIGEIYDVKINDHLEYDLIGEL
jgi:ribosomal protein S12 methylthiotransferase